VRREIFDGVPEKDVQTMTVGNAAMLYGFEE
jgi:hypothetical protein